MKLFKVYLYIFLFVALFVGISRFFSPTYTVVSSTIVNQPLDTTFNYLSNIKNWEQWSLWNKSLDSTLILFYNKRYDTLGARQYLSGEILGKGFIEITHYNKNKELAYRLTLREGEITANGRFQFKSINSQQTEISWIDTGNVGNNPIKRYMIPMVTKGTAQSFNEGLARIKVQLELRTPH